VFSGFCEDVAVSELPDGSLVSMDLLAPFEPEKVMEVEAGDFA